MTTMNTGAASLSDEQIEAIKHLIARGSTFPDHNGRSGASSRVEYQHLQAAAPVLSRLLSAPTPQADAAPSLPRYTEWLHLRTHGQWSDGVPEWARDHDGRMNDVTAANAVIEELADAAIAAGGAQEAVAWKVDGLNGYNESAPSVWLKKDNAEAAAARLFKSSITPLAGPLPRVAATAWQPIETAPKDGTEVWAFNGEQARMLWSEGEEWSLWVWADQLLADADPEPDQPTHWQPLPSAPAAPNGEKA
jgi:hypothetical protein